MLTVRLLVVSALLSSVLGLAACGGGGGGYGNNPPSGAAPSKLFGADSPHMAIGSLANPNPGAGTFPVDRTIMGPIYTELSNNIGSLALDPALDYLYVGNGTSVRVFYMASMANGDATPLRVISGIGNTGSLFLDTTPNNRLYVGDDAFGQVQNFLDEPPRIPAPGLRDLPGEGADALHACRDSKPLQMHHLKQVGGRLRQRAEAVLQLFSQVAYLRGGHAGGHALVKA